MKSNHRRTHRFATPVVAGLLFGSTIGADFTLRERTAEAAIDPLTVVGYLKTAYSYYQQVKALLGDKGPTLGQQLQAIQSAIIGELRSQRNQSLKANTESVFNLFRNLADNSKTDPTNAGLWTNLLTLQQTTTDQFYDIIMNANDVESSYQLAPAYNALVGTGTGVLKLKGEIWSRNPSSWSDFHYWLRPAVVANYKLVGSQFHQCDSMTNPGYRPMPSATQPDRLVLWLLSVKPGRLANSDLWRKIANRKFQVARGTAECRMETDDFVTLTGTQSCNPITGKCTWEFPTEVDDWRVLSCSGARVTTNLCSSNSTSLSCAAQLAQPVFAADPVVKVVRAGMTGVLTVSGGNEGEASQNNALVASGKLVDPWVNEPSCPTGWAYPQVP